MSEIIIIPSRFSYNFLIKFFYNFELCDHFCYYPLLFSICRNGRCKDKTGFVEDFSMDKEHSEMDNRSL